MWKHEKLYLGVTHPVTEVVELPFLRHWSNCCRKHSLKNTNGQETKKNYLDVPQETYPLLFQTIMTVKLVFAVSPLSRKHRSFMIKSNDWNARFKIMCPSGAIHCMRTVVTVTYSYENPNRHVGLIQSMHHLIKK